MSGGHRYSNIIEEQVNNGAQRNARAEAKALLRQQFDDHMSDIHGQLAMAEFSRTRVLKHRFEERFKEIEGFKGTYEALLATHGGDAAKLNDDIEAWRKENERRKAAGETLDTDSAIAKAGFYQDFFLGDKPRAKEIQTFLDDRLKSDEEALVTALQSSGRVTDPKKGTRETISKDEAQAIVDQMKAVAVDGKTMKQAFTDMTAVDAAKGKLMQFHSEIMDTHQLALEEQRTATRLEMMALYAGKKPDGLWGDKLFQGPTRTMSAQELRGIGTHFIRATMKGGDLTNDDLMRNQMGSKLSADEAGAILGVLSKHMALSHGQITLANGAIHGMTEGAQQLFKTMFNGASEISVENWSKFTDSLKKSGQKVWADGTNGAHMVKYNIQLNEIAQRSGLLKQLILHPEQNPFGAQYLTAEDKKFMQEDMGGLYTKVLKHKLGDEMVAKLESISSGGKTALQRLIEEGSISAEDVTALKGMGVTEHNQILFRSLVYADFSEIISPIFNTTSPRQHHMLNLLDTYVGIKPANGENSKYMAKYHYQGFWGGVAAMFRNHRLDIPEFMMKHVDDPADFERSLKYAQANQRGFMPEGTTPAGKPVAAGSYLADASGARDIDRARSATHVEGTRLASVGAALPDDYKASNIDSPAAAALKRLQEQQARTNIV